MGSAGENFCLRWNEFESNISSSFKELRSESDFFDVTLGCSDSNGRSLQAHKVILSACSSFFKGMLREQQTSSPNHPNPYIYLRGVSFGDLSSILDFMYHGEVNVAQEDLNSFLAVAEELQIKGLTNKDGEQPSAAKKAVRKSEASTPGPAPKRARRSPAPSSAPNSSSDVKTVVDIKSDPDPEAGPSAVNADYTGDDDQADLDYGGDYYQDGNGEESMLEADVSTAEGEEGSGGKGVEQEMEPLHITDSDTGKVSKRWQCKLCSFSSKFTTNVRAHIARKHHIRPLLSCKHCGKCLANESTLVNHQFNCANKKAAAAAEAAMAAASEGKLILPSMPLPPGDVGFTPSEINLMSGSSGSGSGQGRIVIVTMPKKEG